MVASESEVSEGNLTQNDEEEEEELADVQVPSSRRGARARATDSPMRKRKSGPDKDKVITDQRALACEKPFLHTYQKDFLPKSHRKSNRGLKKKSFGRACMQCGSARVHCALEARGSYPHQEAKIVSCVGCGAAYHMHCLHPPLRRLPTKDWCVVVSLILRHVSSKFHFCVWKFSHKPQGIVRIVLRKWRPCLVLFADALMT